MYSLADCLTDMKDFRLAITIYKEIVARDPENARFTYSTMARLCLQVVWDCRYRDGVDVTSGFPCARGLFSE